MRLFAFAIVLLFSPCAGAGQSGWRFHEQIDPMTDRKNQMALTPAIEDPRVFFSINCDGSQIRYFVVGLDFLAKHQGIVTTRFDQQKSRAIRATASAAGVNIEDPDNKRILREARTAETLRIQIVGYEGSGLYTFRMKPFDQVWQATANRCR